MDIKIQQGEGISQAILRQLQSRDDIADDAVLNSEAWNSIFSEFQADENSTHKENKIKEEWTELNMNVHTEVDDDIKIDENVWNKIVDIAKKALNAKEAETTEGETTQEEVVVTEDQCEPTECATIVRHKETGEYYVKKEGGLEKMKPRYGNASIININEDGSWTENAPHEGGEYYIVDFNKDGTETAGRIYDSNNTERANWTDDENGKLKEYHEGSETILYKDGILQKDKDNEYEMHKDLGDGKYVLKIKGKNEYVLYKESQFRYSYVCDENGNEIKS